MNAALDSVMLRDTMISLSVVAGAKIMEIRAEGFDVDSKQDDSPVTKADREAELIILRGLRRAFLDIPIVAEEEMSSGVNVDVANRFFLVDPLDGTREFTQGRADFTVNIALIEDGTPVAGCVYAPAHEKLYLGLEGQAHRYMIAPDTDFMTANCGAASDLHPVAGAVTRVVASRSHLSPETQKFIDTIPSCEIVSIGSSLKFCILAEGGADLYPRFGPTMEWDTAAGDSILRAAGGMTFGPNGRPLLYGDKNPDTPRHFENGYFISHAIAPEDGGKLGFS